MTPRESRPGVPERCSSPPPELRTLPGRLGPLAAAPLLFLGLLAAPLAAAESYRIVVNASNPIGSVLVSELSGIFLKKVERWDTGLRVTPVDLPAGAPCREAFSRGVHGKDVDAVKKYWRKLVFSGLGEPPQELASEAAVLDFVAHNVGGVAYVCGEAALGERVRVLKLTGGAK